MDVQGFAVGGRYAGALLASMLEGEKAKKRQMAGVSVRSINPHNTTLFIRVVERVMELRVIQLACHDDILEASLPRVKGGVTDPDLCHDKLSIITTSVANYPDIFVLPPGPEPRAFMTLVVFIRIGSESIRQPRRFSARPCRKGRHAD